MDRTPSRGQGRHAPKTPSKTLLKGLFADGIWQCNCEPRMPADHFQTRNGGPNHGRWFYTCQKAAPHRCGFFLWDSDAKPREAQAVLSNSRTEPEAGAAISTTNPKMTPQTGQLSPITPYSRPKPVPQADLGVSSRITNVQSPIKRSDDWLLVSDDEDDDWEAPETPSKSIKHNETSSPGKRNREEFAVPSLPRPSYPKSAADVELFNTPNEARGRGLFSNGQPGTNPPTNRTGGLMSPGITPATSRINHSFNLRDPSFEKIPIQRDESPTARKSILHPNPHLGFREESPPPVKKIIEMTPLAQTLLDALQDEQIDMAENIVNTVKAISLKHHHDFIKMEKGRDLCRVRIKKQDAKILELQAEVEKLKGSPMSGAKVSGVARSLAF